MASVDNFSTFINKIKAQEKIVIQPRMGFGSIEEMRTGLLQVKSISAPTIGTITVDSFTRQGDFHTPQKYLQSGEALNGFPIVTHGAQKTQKMIQGIESGFFPVQLRHGTPLPEKLFQVMIDSGIYATEGGPISYCLPYSRVPLEEAIGSWTRSCHYFSRKEVELGAKIHMESFGGCLLGQLCPPSLLVAVSLLEGIFFQRHGVNSVSLSFTQGISMLQDWGALKALRKLGEHYLSDNLDWHIVLYTFMGKFPYTPQGAKRLINDSVLLAMNAACERLIVKTTSEVFRIPKISDNISALKLAFRQAEKSFWNATAPARVNEFYESIFLESKTIVDTVLNLSEDINKCISIAFSEGLLDIPYCLHPDNRGMANSYIDNNGAIRWGDIGKLPLSKKIIPLQKKMKSLVTSNQLLEMINFNVNKYDK